MTRRPESGVTLIELLIAVSLVSFISVGMMVAMRVGFNALDKTNNRFLANRKALSVQRIIESQVSGIIPVSAKCQTAGGPGGRFSMFEGLPDEMRFVSSYSLAEAARGYPRLLEFKVIPGEDDRGVRLIVDERIYGGPFMVGSLCMGFAPVPGTNVSMPRFQPIEVGPASFVLADKLSFCRISYRRTMPPPVLESWAQVWTVPDMLPSGVRIELAPLEPDPSRLQVMTVSVPLRVDRKVLGSDEE